MTPRTARLLLSLVFLSLGSWALLAPGLAVELTIRQQYQSDARLVTVLMGAFGAQAVLSGLFAALGRFTRTTFLAYGLTLPAFFVFNWWFFAVEPLLAPLGLLDAAGNVVMLALCIVGWRGLPPGKAA